MQEELTPLERSRLYFSGKRVDRLPCGLLGIETGCSLYGVSPRDALCSANAGIEIQKHLIEDFSADSISYGPDLKGLGEALGTQVIYPEQNICYVARPVLQKYTHLDELKCIDIFQQGRMPQILEVLKRLKDKYGNTHSIDNSIAGPLSTAAAIRGTDTILKDMIKNPEELHKLLNFTVEVNLRWVQHVWNTCEATVSIADPVASESMLGAKRFREFAKPYLINLCKNILRITGKKPSLHICGKTNNLWKEFPDIGISGFSLDNCENLEQFKNTVGEYITIGGNIDPTGVMRFGTPSDVDEALKRCLEKGSDSQNGYIPGAGCQIPLGTPKENLYALVKGVKKYTRNTKIGEKILFY